MRVVYIGQSGPYSPEALRLLLGHDVFEIVLVVEGRSRPMGRLIHQWLKPSPAPLPPGDSLAPIAVAAGVPCLKTSDINHTYCRERIAAMNPDWLVCVGFDRLFCPELLATAQQGGLNAHPSDLPKFRGPSPIFWALKEGARRLPVVIHHLDAHEDHGPICGRGTISLPERASGATIYRLAAKQAAHLLLHTLSQGSTEGIAQDDSLASRAPRPKPEDAFFDPSTWDCQALVNFVSAAAFFRAAWTRLGDEVFFIRSGLSYEIGRRMPGHYLRLGDELVVQCRDGLATLEIQQ
ncbi:MAG: formyltransferase family protein [Myxococcota bacterium]